MHTTESTPQQSNTDCNCALIKELGFLAPNFVASTRRLSLVCIFIYINKPFLAFMYIFIVILQLILENNMVLE